MQRAVVALLITIGGTSLSFAQVRPPSPPSPIKAPEPTSHTEAAAKARTEGGSITVEGCLHGSSIEPLGDRNSDQVLALYSVTYYDLELSRAQKERLIGHDGHAERVTGTLRLPSDESRMFVSKGLGTGTRITATSGGSGASPGVPLIEVKSVEHLADRCAAPPQRDPDPNRTGDVLPTPARSRTQF